MLTLFKMMVLSAAMVPHRNLYFYKVFESLLALLRFVQFVFFPICSLFWLSFLYEAMFSDLS